MTFFRSLLAICEKLCAGPGRLQLKQYGEARKTYTAILALDPDSLEAKYQLMLKDKLGL